MRPSVLRPRLLAALASLILAACSSPIDLAAEVELPAHREAGPSCPHVLVRLGQDHRDPVERGRRRFQGASFIGTDVLREPADVALLRVLARDLVACGLAEEASLDAKTPTHVLTVSLHRLSASFTEGVETLPFLLPTSSIAAAADLRIVFADDVGREFMDATCSAETSRQAAALEGLGSAAASALARAIRAALDQMLPKIAPAMRAYAPESGS